MVQNLMGLRFANSVFEPLWNRFHISLIQIVFKEDIGTEGRGGYFDQFGIIRDVMQNHLLQIMALVAMEPPITLSAEDVRDEKVKLLRSVPPITLQDLVIGQYGRDATGQKESYLDDKTVPQGSVTPTFATAVLHVNNSRWRGVPFILKCGKALNERKAEIRIQFLSSPSGLYKSPPNELVIRVQPNEAVYLKLSAKEPGLSDELHQMELDLTYKERFATQLPEAYERLIYDVIRGDHNLFVRDDELTHAWKIFTPILHEIELKKIHPIIYPFGSRGPQESDKMVKEKGFIRNEEYVWNPLPKSRY
jgi:glucose-6-phosphate 1-dehydrogenase